jgi:GTPase SAR1 family protein
MLFVYDGLRSQNHIQIGCGVLFLFYVQLLGCLAIPIEYGRKAKQVSRPFCFYVCLSVGACGRGKIFCVMMSFDLILSCMMTVLSDNSDVVVYKAIFPPVWILLPLLSILGLVVWKWKKLSGTSIAVLGDAGVGKTQLYYTLQGKVYDDPKQTNKDDIPEFDYECNGKTYKIKNGEDWGGNEGLRPVWWDLVKGKDIIVFIFDVNKYLTVPEYEKKTNSIMADVWNLLKVNEKENKHICIGSHIDELKSYKKEKAIADVQDKLKNTPYSELVKGNFDVIDVRDKKEVEGIFKKVLK